MKAKDKDSKSIPHAIMSMQVGLPASDSIFVLLFSRRLSHLGATHFDKVHHLNPQPESIDANPISISISQRKPAAHPTTLSTPLTPGHLGSKVTGGRGWVGVMGRRGGGRGEGLMYVSMTYGVSRHGGPAGGPVNGLSAHVFPSCS